MIIAVSGYFGDAVWGCGGALAEVARTPTQRPEPAGVATQPQRPEPAGPADPPARRAAVGSRCLIVTAFTATAPSSVGAEPAGCPAVDGRGDRDAILRCRWDDLHAAGRLGAAVTHLELVAANHRRGRHGQAEYTAEADLFDVARPPAEHLVTRLASAIARIVSAYRPEIVYIPLAAGGHVDHRACRLAADGACRQCAWPVRVRYYGEPTTRTVQTAEDSPGGAHLEVGQAALSAAAFASKVAALGEYRSLVELASPGNLGLHAAALARDAAAQGVSPVEHWWWPARPGPGPGPDGLAPAQHPRVAERKQEGR